MIDTNWVLVREGTHEEVLVDDTITNFRGDSTVLKGGRPPHKAGSTGRVFVAGGEYFPSVFDLAWIQKKGGEKK